MEFAVVVLMTSTLASTGLVALWAATSPRPWYARAAASVAVIAPLAFVPAAEPLAALAIEAAAVATGVGMWRWGVGGIDAQSRTRRGGCGFRLRRCWRR